MRHIFVLSFLSFACSRAFTAAARAVFYNFLFLFYFLSYFWFHYVFALVLYFVFFAFSFVYFLISLFCDKPSQQRSSARQRRGLSLMRKMQILHSQTNLKAILSRRRLKQSVSRKMERQNGTVWCGVVCWAGGSAWRA